MRGGTWAASGEGPAEATPERLLSSQGFKGLMTSDTDRVENAKETYDELGINFVSYDIVQGPFDFVAVAEGDAEQAITMKGAVSMSGDFDQVHICTSVSLDNIRNNVKKIMSAYTPPSG